MSLNFLNEFLLSHFRFLLMVVFFLAELLEFLTLSLQNVRKLLLLAQNPDLLAMALEVDLVELIDSSFVIDFKLPQKSIDPTLSLVPQL